MSLQAALSDIAAAWPALVPPNRVSVTQGAADNLVIKRPGGASGNWSPAETPYMVEPGNMLSSRKHKAVCFVGPSQSGKTVIFGEGWLAHAAANDIGDMLLVQMNQVKADEYKKQRIDRMFRHSPNLKALKTSRAHDDSVRLMTLRNGMMVRFGWPTAANLSSTSYRYVYGTDYDRWPFNIDGEGDGFTMMLARITTYLSRGKVAVESSPGYPATDPTWQPSSPHEAPPCGTEETGGGILSIYNRGDRRRLYWKCPHCGEWFEAKPGLDLFRLPAFEELVESIRTLDIPRFVRQHSHITCPHCETRIEPHQREAMNLGLLDGRGGWLAEGLRADAQDRISGTPRESSIASYWLGGVAATYRSWPELLETYMQAVLTYAETGDELPLQTSANTQQSIPYMSRALAEAAEANARTRPVEVGMQQYVVPDEGRFLIATVDNQGGRNARFVVQVHAVGPYKEEWLIDRYEIKWSKRPGPTGDDFAPLDPAQYAEDWDIITDRVINATYRTNDPTREMKVYRTIIDSGGEDGVTDQVYAYYRRLRRQGLHQRVRITKGVPNFPDWHWKETFVGGGQGRGDVPLYLVEPNKFKDQVRDSLAKVEPGPGYYHFPPVRSPSNPEGWITQAFMDEFKAEVRGADGRWTQVKPRNESLDLAVMVKFACNQLGVDRRGFWDSPPRWAQPHDTNSEIVTPEARREAKAAPGRPAMGPAAGRLAERRSAGRARVGSSYLRG